MPRSFILLSNWEAYLPLQPTLETVEKLLSDTQFPKDQQYVCLPYNYLHEGKEKLSSLPLTVGVNDMNSVEPETFTESIATKLLRDASAQFVLLGSSLKRIFLKEAASSINKKIHSALEANIQPFLCFGESISDFEEGKGADLNRSYLQECLKDIHEESFQKLSLVYDTSAIIRNKPDVTIQDINESYKNCQQLCLNIWGESATKSIQILCAIFNLSDLKPELIENTICSGFYLHNK